MVTGTLGIATESKFIFIWGMNRDLFSSRCYVTGTLGIANPSSVGA
jgi:hypothetical protein